MRAPVVEPQQQPDVRMTRRQRRAAARGGATPAGRVPVKAGPTLPPPPVRHRDYATRKH
jgi:hypothetical protein